MGRGPDEREPAVRPHGHRGAGPQQEDGRLHRGPPLLYSSRPSGRARLRPPAGGRLQRWAGIKII